MSNTSVTQLALIETENLKTSIDTASINLAAIVFGKNGIVTTTQITTADIDETPAGTIPAGAEIKYAVSYLNTNNAALGAGSGQTVDSG